MEGQNNRLFFKVLATNLCREGEAEEVIEAPACINKPEKELTQHERDLIKEYKDRLRQKEEEEMKRQKQLEARLKQAKQEVLDICNKFDESLIELHNHKMKVKFWLIHYFTHLGGGNDFN